MKKLILAVFLSVGICAAGVQAEAYASEPAVQEEETAGNEGEVREEYVDLSDSIIQEGGFPKAEAASGRRMRRSAADTQKEKAVQEALMKTWDSFETSCALSSFGLTKEEVKTIYLGTLNTQPRYFYVESKYTVWSSGTGIVSKVDVEYRVSKNEAMRQSEAYNSAIADAVRNADQSWSDMEKALYVNDYLARNCEYDTNYKNYSSYNALVDKKAVCQGYALAFLELTRQMGVPCEVVTSDSVNHAWNMIKVGDSYYHVDVTWNDPVKDQLGRARHIYFMKSTPFFKEYGSGTKSGSHFKEDDWVFTGSTTYDTAANTSYDNYIWDNIDTGFDYIDGLWYGFDGNDSICTYTCDGKQFSKKGSIIKVNDIWNVIGGSGYWNGTFVGTGFFNGEYYYSGSTAVYKLDIDTKISRTVYELTDTQKMTGRIYGMNITPSGQLQYVLSESPNESGNIMTIQELSGGQKENLYTIHFDGNGATGSMEDMKFLTSGKKYSLNANQFVNGAKEFAGWNTEQNGNGTPYTDQDTINYQAPTNGATLTLYAQWGECSHKQTEVRNEKKATCKEEGYTGDTYCINCKELVKQGTVIEKKPHTPAADEGVAPTCTTDGKTEGSHCSECGEVLLAQTELPALGHDWNTEFETDYEATEESEGQKSRHCLRAGCDAITDIQIIPKVEKGHEHVIIEIQEIEATCTREGKTAGTSCEVCGAILSGQQTIPKKEHTEEMREAVEATCTANGRTAGTSCEVCGAILSGQQIIPAKGHTEVIDGRAVEATCTANGRTAGILCQECGAELQKSEIIPAKGHSFGPWEIRRNPQIGIPGKKVRVCTVCQETEEEEIPALKDTVVKVSSISITTPLSLKIAEGKKVTLSAVVLPANASDKGVIWSSSNTKVAKVDQNGRVSVLKKSGGKKAVITAAARDGSGKKASVTIQSMKGAVKKVVISGKKTVKAGKTLKLKVKITAAKKANKKVKWKSSNKKYATVSSSGKVKTLKAGKGKKVKITAMATDGSGKKKTFTIKIK